MDSFNLSAGTALKVPLPPTPSALATRLQSFSSLCSPLVKKGWQIGAGCGYACMHMCMCLLYFHLKPLRTWSHKVLSIFISCWLFGENTLQKVFSLDHSSHWGGRRGEGEGNRMAEEGRWEKASRGMWPKAPNLSLLFLPVRCACYLQICDSSQSGNETLNIG